MEEVTGSNPVKPTKFMYTVYVLKSRKNNKRYVGYTTKTIEQRLTWHRWGLTAWTKQNGPFDLLCKEEYCNKQDALRREVYLKSGCGRKLLDEKFEKYRSK